MVKIMTTGVFLIFLVAFQPSSCFDSLLGVRLNRKLEQETTIADVVVLNMKEGNLIIFMQISQQTYSRRTFIL